MAFDTQLFYFLYGLAGRSTFVDGIVVFFANDFAYILVALFLAVVFFSTLPKREKLEMLFVTFASSIIARYGVTELIRFFYHHPRPPVHQLITETSWSFPSGHATFFFALSTAVYLYNKKWGVWFFIASILITVSRVIAGIHYPSDIVGGALIGIIIAYFTFYFVRRLAVKWDHQTS
jgi:undecaprenyl-diphosphatase